MSGKVFKIYFFTMLGLFTLLVNAANAAPVYRAANDHYYELVQNPMQSWQDAKIAAENMSLPGGYVGHLVTITSEEENRWISDTFGSILNSPHAWIGAFQADNSLPADQGWAWVTGEKWTFTNWGLKEPNDYWQSTNTYPGQYETYRCSAKLEFSNAQIVKFRISYQYE